MSERLSDVLKDPWVKSNFISSGIFGFACIAISAIGFAVLRFIGFEDINVSALLSIFGGGGVACFLFGVFGILGQLLFGHYQEPAQK